VDKKIIRKEARSAAYGVEKEVISPQTPRRGALAKTECFRKEALRANPCPSVDKKNFRKEALRVNPCLVVRQACPSMDKKLP